MRFLANRLHKALSGLSHSPKRALCTLWFSTIRWDPGGLDHREGLALFWVFGSLLSAILAPGGPRGLWGPNLMGLVAVHRGTCHAGLGPVRSFLPEVLKFGPPACCLVLPVACCEGSPLAYVCHVNCWGSAGTRAES